MTIQGVTVWSSPEYPWMRHANAGCTPTAQDHCSVRTGTENAQLMDLITGDSATMLLAGLFSGADY